MKHHGYALRKGRRSIAGNIYHITTVTAYRKSVFKQMYFARALTKTLFYAHQHNWVESICFVIMPDHLHWLFLLGKRKSLSQVIASIKRHSSKSIDELRWQACFHDHAVRNDEGLHQLAAYIIHNPVRAGIVESISAYPYWDAYWLPEDDRGYNHPL